MTEFGDSTVTRIDPVTATIVGSPIAGGGLNPYGIAYDGRYMWVASSADDTVRRIDTTTPLPESATFAVGDANGGSDGPVSIAYGGRSVWVGFGISDIVVRVDPRSGLPVGGVDQRRPRPRRDGLRRHETCGSPPRTAPRLTKLHPN